MEKKLEKISVILMLYLLFISVLNFFCPVVSSEETTYTFQKNLTQGWNSITIPVETDWYASDLMANVSGCQYVVKWDHNAQSWIWYTGDGSDFPLLSGYGYSVYMSTANTLLVTGVQVDNASVDLNNEGWNYLGWYKNISTYASDIMDSYADCVSVSIIDSSGEFSIFYNSSIQGTDFIINQGMGYYIRIEEYWPDCDINLINPEPGDILSDTCYIKWNIENAPDEPYAVTIQYTNLGDWVTIVENFDNDNKYVWNTRNVEDGTSYKIKVILKKDQNVDGIYETFVAEDISSQYFTVRNSEPGEEKKGYIYGTIYTDYIGGTPLRLQTFNICKEHCGYSKEEIENEEVGCWICERANRTGFFGSYMHYLPVGTYTLNIAKFSIIGPNLIDFYKSDVVYNVVIKEDQGVVIDFALSNRYESEKEDDIVYPVEEENETDNTLGGEIVITKEGQGFKNEIFKFNDVNIVPINIEKNNVSIKVDGSENITGRVIIFNLKDNVFDNYTNLTLKYDDITIRMADDFNDILNPNNDGSHPEYLILTGENGTEILVSIPHFSEHIITISPLKGIKIPDIKIIEETEKQIKQNKEIVAVISVVVIILAAVFMFRRGKEED